MKLCLSLLTPSPPEVIPILIFVVNHFFAILYGFTQYINILKLCNFVLPILNLFINGIMLDVFKYYLYCSTQCFQTHPC